MSTVKNLVIAIDGPCGSGKTTMAKRIADDLHITNINTGNIFRGIALYKLMNPEMETNEILSSIDLEVNDVGEIILNKEDVTSKLSSTKVAAMASSISAIGEVRDFVLQIERKLAEDTSVVLEGRDIGTVVFPDADCKIYLTANPLIRAYRRYKDLINGGEVVKPETVLEGIIKRDMHDSTRAIAPLRKADDAELIDSSDMTIDEVEDMILLILQGKCEEV